MNKIESGFDPAQLARESVRDPRLTRPDWTRGDPRDPRLIWLDKNENGDPELWRVAAEVVGEVIADSAWALSTYPESARVYAKLGTYVGVGPEHLTLTPGSDGVIRAVFEAFVNPGDVVVHTTPTFAMYPVYSQMYGARPITLAYRCSDGGPVLAVQDVLRTIESAHAKLVCLPNPDSPTGTVFSVLDLRVIADACHAAGSLLLIDEAYHPFYAPSAAHWVEELHHVVVARTFAKAWGLAGLRVGYAVAHPSIARLLHKVRSMYEVSTIAVAVIDRALDREAEMRASVGRLNAGRDGFQQAMASLGLRTISAQGNFTHVAFGTAAPAVHAALERVVVYRKDGGEGCLSGYSRFSATTSERFHPIVVRIRDVITGVPA